MNLDAALDRLVEELKPWASINRATTRVGASNHGCDVWIPDLARKIARRPDGQLLDDEVALVTPTLCDAAAELMRIGVVRPGASVPTGTFIMSWAGEGFSLTEAGREWVLNRPDGPPRDPNGFAAVLAPISGRFDAGFLQRSREAIGCWRTGHYLACCVMCGAAAESILLAVAIAKLGDEDQVLAIYRSAQGRKKLTDAISKGLKGGLKEQLETFVRLLGFWRDEAGHGQTTLIFEPQANLSMLQLLRFAQFAHQEWGILTAR
jgi:hypothetical protein